MTKYEVRVTQIYRDYYHIEAKDEDIHELWKILGRIADDSDNPIYPSEDAEIFIGFYDD